MTFLEAVLGVLLLGMITATLSHVASGTRLNQQRSQARLGAAELANRLVLQFLDDKDSLPSANLPIEYNGQYFRWSRKFSSVGAKVDPAGARSGADINTAEKSLERVQMVTFRVWLAEDSGGSVRYSTDVPTVTISRVYDPLLPTNPDSLMKLLSTPEGLMQVLQNMQNLQEGMDMDVNDGTFQDDEEATAP